MTKVELIRELNVLLDGIKGDTIAERIERLKMEHEAMSSTLAEVENFVPQSTMSHFRRHYMNCVLASRDADPRWRP
jgi:hypothetical protein